MTVSFEVLGMVLYQMIEFRILLVLDCIPIDESSLDLFFCS